MKRQTKIVKSLFRCQLNRFDNRKAGNTVSELTNNVVNLKFPIVNNMDIAQKHLGYKGLHLNGFGSSRLAINLISVIKKLWNDASYPTDFLKYKYSKAKITNPNIKIYSHLERSSTDNSSFTDENEENIESTFSLKKLKATRIANIKRLIIGHININSVQYKFEMLWNSIKGNLDILMISETKLDSTFPSNLLLQGMWLQ